MKTALQIAIALLLCSAACNTAERPNPVSYENKKELTNIRLTGLDQQAVDLGKYKGKAVFINFWATWCKPCLSEMPSIEKAQNLLRNEEIIFLLASDESVEQITEFRTKYDYKFNYARIDNSEDMDFQALPTTFIYSPEGRLVFSEPGERKWDDSANINMILKIIKAK